MNYSEWYRYTVGDTLHLSSLPELPGVITKPVDIQQLKQLVEMGFLEWLTCTSLRIIKPTALIE